MKSLAHIDRETRFVWIAFSIMLVWLFLIALAFVSNVAFILFGTLSGVTGLVPLLLFSSVKQRQWTGVEILGVVMAPLIAVISLTMLIVVAIGLGG